MYSDLIQLVFIAFVFHILMEPEELFDWYGKLIHNLPLWLWKPAGGCLRCFTGQILFWFYLIKYFSVYSLQQHLFFVSLGIVLAITLQYLYDFTQKNRL
jgi:hypothetical protein